MQFYLVLTTIVCSMYQYIVPVLNRDVHLFRTSVPGNNTGAGVMWYPATF